MISIVLPTYNSISFIKERVATIINQTIEEWECVVIDGESTDGTWDYLIDIALKDSRFKMFQFPPKGVYNAWNIGIKKSKGDFIYFATSDDTMTSNCLEELLYGFQLCPRSGIAHCCLTIIDEKSEKVTFMDWRGFPAQQYFKELTNKYHIRKAPLVGVLYATHNTIIHSFTQVLIRKDVFDQIGFFIEDKGPQADLEWGMRAGLTVDIVHVPLELATWRVHKNQLTSIETNQEINKTIIDLMYLALISNKKMNLNSFQIKRILFFKNWNSIKTLPFQKKIFSLEYYKLRFRTIINYDLMKSINNRNRYHEFLMNEVLENDFIKLTEEL